MREKHQELNRKCGELCNQIELMKNPYQRAKDAVIDRLNKFNDLVRNHLQEMMQMIYMNFTNLSMKQLFSFCKVIIET